MATVESPNHQLKRYPVILAPSMNTAMWDHPFTAKQLNTVKDELGFLVVDPVVKMLVCGDLGKGAMADVSSLVDIVAKMATELSVALNIQQNCDTTEVKHGG